MSPYLHILELETQNWPDIDKNDCLISLPDETELTDYSKNATIHDYMNSNYPVFPYHSKEACPCSCDE